MVWSVYMRHWEDLPLITEYEMLCTLTCLKYVPTYVRMNAPVGNNLKPNLQKYLAICLDLPNSPNLSTTTKLFPVPLLFFNKIIKVSQKLLIIIC